ncbi:hypothetical protein C8R47DRAFT_395306 [Mycena vitilis]|nr:hypothetical protein C8R47DRAFT_395306 [Mycena vitilis]
MRFTELPTLMLLALARATSAFTMIRLCDGVNTGLPCINWQGALPSGCFDLATQGQDKTVSSYELAFEVVCTLYADSACKGSSVLLTKTFLNLEDIGFDNMASSFNCVDA